MMLFIKKTESPHAYAVKRLRFHTNEDDELEAMIFYSEINLQPKSNITKSNQKHMYSKFVTLECTGKLFCCFSWNPGHEN